jgi:formylglycine-generating enzyme required for sulfatase activity
MRLRWAVVLAALCVVVTGIAVAYAGEQQRPTERVAPAPEVNAKAAVWRTPEPLTDPQAGDIWISPQNAKEMVYVAAGEFLMGSGEGDGDDDARPQRRVYVDGFWMDKCEVTVGEYRKFCKETGRTMPKTHSSGWTEEHPMVNVRWEDAAAYAQWEGKRLPTEAEWEKAARGEDGRRHPWGTEEPGSSRCNLEGSGDGHETGAPVGSFPSGASAYGCLDMAGNVWEWCADWYGRAYYEDHDDRNPEGPDSGSHKVVRGGCWSSSSTEVRCAARDKVHPSLKSNRTADKFGLRCAKEAG